jgi:hypothetical protein
MKHHYSGEVNMTGRIDRIDDRLQSLPKPPLKRIDDISIGSRDVLILAAGFEDRATGILERLVSANCSGFTTIIIDYRPKYKENKIHKIEELCHRLNTRIVHFLYDRHDPGGAGEQLVEQLDQHNIEGRIFLDISAMSRLFIVQALAAIGKSRRGFSNIEILYCEAQRYPPYEEEVRETINEMKDDSIYRTMFISYGVYEVTVVPELSSIAIQGQPIHLVAFPSFNTDQLASLRGETQPSHFSFLHGIPPLVENAWRPEAIKELNHLEKIRNRKDLEASTLNYQETLDYLLEIYRNYGDIERIVIAPTGSKMQTVAVGIFRTFMNDVQIVYPTPNKFPSPQSYTIGVKNIYVLPLDAFNGLIKKPDD